MKDKVVHEWNEWVLEYREEGVYELIKKNDRTNTRSVIAKNDMDAENISQSIIRGMKEE